LVNCELNVQKFSKKRTKHFKFPLSLFTQRSQAMIYCSFLQHIYFFTFSHSSQTAGPQRGSRDHKPCSCSNPNGSGSCSNPHGSGSCSNPHGSDSCSNPHGSDSCSNPQGSDSFKDFPHKFLSFFPNLSEEVCSQIMHQGS
jgi:hypothetical protein